MLARTPPSPEATLIEAPTRRRPPPKAAILTDELIRKLPLAGQPGAPRGKDGAPLPQYTVRDTKLGGFFAVVGKEDVAFTYQVETIEGGRRTTPRRVVGRFYAPSTQHPKLTTKEARALAQDAIAGVKTRRLVIATRGVTLAEGWAAYKKHLERKGRAASTIAGYQDDIERSLAPLLDKPLRELSEKPQLVAERFEGIVQEAIARRAAPKRGQANPRGIPRAQGVMRVLRAVYLFCRDKVDDALPDRLPTRRCDMDGLKRRQTGMAARELAAWARQLDALGSHVDKHGHKRGNPVRREFHLFLLLSGARPDPIKRARWEHLDLARRVLAVEKDKTRPIDLPLSWAMIRCLQRARRAGRRLHPGSPFIFPAHSKSGHIADQKEERDRLSSFGNDLRQSLITLSQDCDVSDLDCKRLVGHALGGGVTGGYRNRNKLDERALRLKQEWISRYLINALRLPFDGQQMRMTHPSASRR